jgi:hypothetical protein
MPPILRLRSYVGFDLIVQNEGINGYQESFPGH